MNSLCLVTSLVVKLHPNAKTQSGDNADRRGSGGTDQGRKVVGSVVGAEGCCQSLAGVRTFLK